jgi:hypothetical protein
MASLGKWAKDFHFIFLFAVNFAFPETLKRSVLFFLYTSHSVLIPSVTVCHGFQHVVLNEFPHTNVGSSQVPYTHLCLMSAYSPDIKGPFRAHGCILRRHDTTLCALRRASSRLFRFSTVKYPFQALFTDAFNCYNYIASVIAEWMRIEHR